MTRLYIIEATGHDQDGTRYCFRDACEQAHVVTAANDMARRAPVGHTLRVLEVGQVLDVTYWWVDRIDEAYWADQRKTERRDKA